MAFIRPHFCCHRLPHLTWPVARALMKAHEGDIVDVRAPSGVEQIEMLEIRYGGASGETE